MDHTLIIGLGNPGAEFKETYHNVGARAVDRLAEQASGADAAPKFRTHGDSFSYAKIGGRIFVHPLVFMNESGRAVKDAMHAFGGDAKDIIIIHDDSDLPVGEFKRAEGGGSAGHNGIRSIIDHLGTEDFARIRIGIREKDEVHRKKAGDFVLSPIRPNDKKLFEEVFNKISGVL
jgi:PTH1 family peptidyl-tRNA hydrolase